MLQSLINRPNLLYKILDFFVEFSFVEIRRQKYTF